MIKRIFILLAVAFICLGCGLGYDSSDGSVSGTAEQKQLLQQYIKDTQGSLQTFNNNRRLIAEVNESNAGKAREIINQHRESLQRVKVPANCPQAKKLAKLRERRCELLEDMLDYMTGNRIVGFVALLLGEDKDIANELDEISKEVDAIYEFAEMEMSWYVK